jgi:hypothetical protein
MTENERRITLALINLRAARNLLRKAGAVRAAERVRLAITSAGGALRHARSMAYRDERGESERRKIKHVRLKVVSA